MRWIGIQQLDKHVVAGSMKGEPQVAQLQLDQSVAGAARSPQLVSQQHMGTRVEH